MQNILCLLCEERIGKGELYITTDNGDVCCCKDCWIQLAKGAIGYHEDCNEE